MRPQAKAAMLSRMSKSEHEIYKESVDCINKHLQVSDQSKIRQTIHFQPSIYCMKTLTLLIILNEF